MTKQFEERVIRERMVDTKKYRYAVKTTGTEERIERLPLTALDTTEAINGWEVVKVLWKA